VRERPSEEGIKEIIVQSFTVVKENAGEVLLGGQITADSDALLLPFHKPTAGTGFLLFSLKMSSKLPRCCL
jgi:hypothetical protein